MQITPAHFHGFGGFSNIEDIFSAFGDIFGGGFGDIFGGGTRRRRTRQTNRGSDLQLKLKLTLEFESDQKTHMIKKVNMRLTLPPNFPEKYIPAIVKAMDLCYVKKHLHEPPAFETTTQRAK